MWIHQNTWMKNGNPILELNDEYDLWSSDLTLLLSQYTLTQVTLSPTISRWSSPVFVFCALAFVSCIFVSPFKRKPSSRFLLFYFLFCIPCIQFIANLSVNSLQILVRSYLSSELRWQVFSLRWTRSHRAVYFGPTEPFQCHRNTNSVLPISLQEKHLATCFWILFDPASLNESCPRPASYSNFFFVLWLKDQTHHDKNTEEPFLEIDVKGGERDHHIKA